MRQVLKALEQTAHPLRNKAMVGLLWDCCLRLSEVVGLKKEAVNLEQREIKVWGKGGKEKIIPLGAWTAKQMPLYMFRERPESSSD